MIVAPYTPQPKYPITLNPAAFYTDFLVIATDAQLKAVRLQMVDFFSGQGRSEVESAGVAALG
jgi:hypothetical protein